MQFHLAIVWLQFVAEVLNCTLLTTICFIFHRYLRSVLTHISVLFATASSMILLTMISAAAFAADSGSGKIRLDSAVKVGSTKLPAGDYKVTWSGSGDNAQVTLTQGKTKATATAQLVEVRRNTDAISTENENGSRVLTKIQFRDKTLLLHEAPSQVAGQ